MDLIITDYLSKLEFGELQMFKNMAVISLMNSLNHGPEYISLGEALQKGLLTITEVSKEGMVPELKVFNAAEIPVLLLDGEELAGAKQNRVVNTTILLLENSETIIPVSCTEQGRWSYVSSVFSESGHVAHKKLRSKKAFSVSRTLNANRSYSGDQGMVWNDLRSLSLNTGIQSRTGAMRDIYEGTKENLQEYIEAFNYFPNQKGMVVMINGKVAGLDVLSRPPVFEHLFPKLVKSYALDASLEKQGDHERPSVERARTFLEEARSCNETKFKSVGYGWDHRFESNHLVGSALLHEEQVIHLAFFEVDEGERIGRISSASGRRRFRL